MKAGVVMGSKFSLNEKSSEMTEEMKAQSKALPFYFVFFGVCVLLLSLIGEEVRIFSDKGWYLQPMLGPAIGLTIMTVMSFAKLMQGIRYVHYVSVASAFQYFARIISVHRVTLWAIAAFYVYIHAVSVTGFFLSNLVLLLFMLFISKKLDRKWALAALGAALAIVVIFRVVIGLWMDEVWLYSLLPDAMADFCNMYL